jgi:hypothetical protein
VTRLRRLLTRGRLIACAVSLVLGIGWVVVLGLLPSGLDPVVRLLLGLVGIFGVVGGILVATGTLVRVLTLFGTRPGSVSSGAGDLAPDVVFGICVVCFALPSLLAYYGG